MPNFIYIIACIVILFIGAGFALHYHYKLKVRFAKPGEHVMRTCHSTVLFGPDLHYCAKCGEIDPVGQCEPSVKRNVCKTVNNDISAEYGRFMCLTHWRTSTNKHDCGGVIVDWKTLIGTTISK